ncbi:uncharacterized protein LOC129611437 isoform X2 [Condylostylus longicornis]|nr:uncharacterized protein LOC129611437 isoform X2 [Condylostylus longicornis]
MEFDLIKTKLDTQNNQMYREKCGEIYRIKSEFIYYCCFCFENYYDIIKFHIHIHQNHHECMDASKEIPNFHPEASENDFDATDSIKFNFVSTNQYLDTKIEESTKTVIENSFCNEQVNR